MIVSRDPLRAYISVEWVERLTGGKEKILAEELRRNGFDMSRPIKEIPVMGNRLCFEQEVERR